MAMQVASLDSTSPVQQDNGTIVDAEQNKGWDDQIRQDLANPKTTPTARALLLEQQDKRSSPWNDYKAADTASTGPWSDYTPTKTPATGVEAAGGAETGPWNAFSSPAEAPAYGMQDRGAGSEGLLPSSGKYLDRVGYGWTHGLTTLVSGLRADIPSDGNVPAAPQGNTAGGLAASLPALATQMMSWIKYGAYDYPVGSVKHGLGWGPEPQTLEEHRDDIAKIGEFFQPDNPSREFQAGFNAMSLPFTALTEGIKELPESLQAGAEAITMIAGARGGVKAKTKVRGVEPTPRPKAPLTDAAKAWGIDPKSEAPPSPITPAVAKVLEPIKAVEGDVVGSASPVRDPSKVPTFSRDHPSYQSDLFRDLPSKIEDLKQVDPEKLQAMAKEVEKNTIAQGDPLVAGKDQPSTIVSRAEQIDQLWHANELSKRLEEQAQHASEEITLKGIPEQAPVDLPPVAEGNVRLWRGYDKRASAQAGEVRRERAGQWFSSDRDTAASYGTLSYVDVPKHVADMAAGEGAQGHLAVILPKEWAGKAAREVAEPANMPNFAVGPGAAMRGGAKRRSISFAQLFPGEANPNVLAKSSNARVAVDGRTVVGWALENFEEAKDLTSYVDSDNGRDIRYKLGVATSSFRANNPLINRPDSLPDWIFRIVNDHIAMKVGEAHALNAIYHVEDAKYNAYYNLAAEHVKGQPIQNLGRAVKSKFTKVKDELFQHDNAIRLEMEKDNSTWFDGKNYSPTVEQFMQHGMSRESAEVWHGQAMNYEKMWSITEKTTGMAEMETPPRIPGYVSHVWKGAYSVVGKLDGEHFKEFNYNTRSQMMRGIEQIKESTKDRDDITWETRVPGSGGSTAAEMISGIMSARAKYEDSPKMQAMLKKIEDASIRGIVSSVLDRADTPVGGHLLERVNLEQGKGGITRKERIKAMTVEQEIREAMSQWHVQVKFTSEVLGPLDLAGLIPNGKNKNLRSAITDIVNSFLGHPDKIAKEADQFITDILVRWGQDPALLAKITGAAHSGFANYYLRFKPSYYEANFFQKTITIPAMLMDQAQMMLAGEKVPSVSVALKNWATDHETNVRVKHYLSDHGHNAPVMIESLAGQAGADPVMKQIEKNTRNSSGLQKFHLARQVMSEEAALKFAGAGADEVSVPYSSRSGQPVLFSKFPNLFKPIYLFATFNSNMMSLNSKGVRVMIEALNNGGAASPRNYNAAFKALQGVAALNAVNMAIFGLPGLALTSNWDALSWAISKASGEYLPNTADLAQQLGVWAKTKLGKQGTAAGDNIQSTAQIGLASTAIRYDMSSSGQGPGLTFNNFAGWDSISSLADTVLLGLRQATKGDVSRNQVLQTVKDQPPQIAQPLEYLLKTGFDLQKIYGMATGTVPDYSIGRTESGHQDINTLGRQRDRWDTMMALFGGQKHVQEKLSDISDAIVARKEAVAKIDIARSKDIIDDPTSAPADRIKQIMHLMQAYREDPNPLLDGIDKAMEKSLLTNDQRRAVKAATNATRMMWYEQQQKLRKEEPTKTPMDLLR